MKILVFGSCNVDIVYSLDSIVRPKETVSAAKRNLFPGGKGFNQAIALAKAGVNVSFAGSIGKDGEWLRELLETNKVNTKFLKTAPTETGHAVIQVDNEGQNAIFIYPGANGEIKKTDVDRVLSHFSSGDFIVLQNEISELFYIIHSAAKKGMQVILNPSPFQADFLRLPLEKIAYLILNETEACGFTNTENPFDLITKVKENGLPTKIVLTLGEKGSAFWDGETLWRSGIYRTKVIDTTAAGDTFTGYFIAELGRGKSPEKILKIASAASAVAISRRGASSSVPTPEEVKTAMKTYPYCDMAADANQQKVLSYLREHLADASLNDLAALLGFSENYAGKWISAQFHSGFSALLQEERMKRSAQLLTESRLPIEEIIPLVGYRNGSHFRRIFKEKYGVSPFSYRKEYAHVNE